MSKALKNAAWRRWLWVAVGTAGLWCAGCTAPKKPVNLMGDNFNDEFAHWGEDHRPKGGDGDLDGLSTKSQQIERNLGVR
jgi:hypothetical protein